MAKAPMTARRGAYRLNKWADSLQPRRADGRSRASPASPRVVGVTVIEQTAGDPAFRLAIAMLAALAYPGDSNKDIANRDDFWRACWEYLKRSHLAHYRPPRKSVPKRFVALGNRPIRQKLHNAATRIFGRRFVAVEMARGLAFVGSSTPLRLTVGDIKVDGLMHAYELAYKVRGDRGWGRDNFDWRNIRRTVWIDSLPVLHLAMGCVGAINRLVSEGKLPAAPTVEQLVHQPAWAPIALEKSARLLPLLSAHPKIKLPTASAIRFEVRQT